MRPLDTRVSSLFAITCVWSLLAGMCNSPAAADDKKAPAKTAEVTADGDSADAQWIVIEPSESAKSAAGAGKNIVLVSGDEEYRSEEALPQLAKILAKHHGFRCTVLFAIERATGVIDPNVNDNIPGLEALRTADLMIIATRFRNLPDDQMAEVVAYIESGRPMIGMRTATHAFNIPADRKYAKYGFSSSSFDGGFGRQVLGETWISHHGNHGSQSTRGRISEQAAKHPILRGIEDGAIWGPTDVYGVTLPLPGDSQPLVLGEVVAGMTSDSPPVEGGKNSPMMPVAWIKSYKTESGKVARVFTTTMGAATDLSNVEVRRMLVNAAYWGCGLEDSIPAESNVELVGEYNPTQFSFGGAKKGIKPAQLK